MMTTHQLKKYLTPLILLITIILSFSINETDAIRAHVRITNMLGQGTNAQIRCLSEHGGPDVPTQDVPFMGLYEFGFTPSIWGLTNYNCEFVFNGASHWFQIYNEHRERNVCSSLCWWIIKVDGPCLIQKIDYVGVNNEDVDCKPWNN
ncbi:hypothetical protein RND81_14G232200 [Saponaria officinalis]|uniref:S-protein homolog n=1 Tax=Saponaria officinalis TaxID=3572 RepID=A0AAW1GUA7_SAPOF